VAHRSHKHAAGPARRLRATSSILPTAGLLAIAVAGFAATAAEDTTPAAATTTARPAAAAAPSEQPEREDIFAAAAEQGPAVVSRSAERPPLPNEAEAEDKVEGQLFAVQDVEIHADADGDSPVLADVDSGDTVDVTGEKEDGWAQIMHKGLPRWVDADALATKMPLGSSPCPSGSSAESGLLPDTIKVHRAVCAAFPSVTSYGGVAGRGEHATGHALDIMVSSDVGTEIATFLQENRAELGIEYLIWRQRIWRPSTSGAWRGMSDRGGATANHMDHVHVTTYGNAGR
jgi:hypothetical protein